MFLQKHTSLPYWSLILAKIDIASISKIVGYRILHNLICHLQKMIINSIIYIRQYACKNDFHCYMLKYAIMWVSKIWDYGLRFEPSVIATVARTVSCDFFSGKQNNACYDPLSKLIKLLKAFPLFRLHFTSTT